MLTAILLFLGTLGIYDFRLKNEYSKIKQLGSESYYRANRFNDHKEIKIKSFNQIDIKAANVIGITVEYGKKEAVYIRQYSTEMIEVRQENNKLIVDLSEKGKTENYIQTNPVTIIIISPNLASIETQAITYKTATINKGTKTEMIIRHYGECRTAVFGYKQDSLKLQVGASTNISLHNNFLKFFNAEVGDTNGNAELIILSDNNLETVKLDVKGKSKVEILDNEVQRFDHHISDSATVTFRGLALPKL
jgi:hypothetical protein